MQTFGQLPERPPVVAIVDCGLGNLFSVKRACEHVGMRGMITSQAGDIFKADIVLLPGVGAFGDAMDSLRRSDLCQPLVDVAATGKPLIGICLGLQLLMTESSEFGCHRGLGLIEGSVVRFENPRGAHATLKVPQVGWNRLFRPAHDTDNSQAWQGTPLEDTTEGEFMYFVHSFYAQPEDPHAMLSVSVYGDIVFCSAIRKGNVSAFQFHPERSGPAGLDIYRRISAIARGRGRSLAAASA